MKKIIYLLSLMTLSLLMQIKAQTNDYGAIHLQIDSLKNDQGQLLISIYSNEKTFLKQPDTTIRVTKKELYFNHGIKEIIHLYPGEYAIAICDDENLNDTMNYNFIGIPCEGFGFSGNIKPKIKAPKFKDCKFIVNSDSNKLLIEMIYKKTYHEKNN